MTIHKAIQMKEAKKLTPAKQVRESYQHCRLTQRLSAAGLDDHLIIATSAIDFATKYYSHELGTHRYCLPVPNHIQLPAETKE